ALTRAQAREVEHDRPSRDHQPAGDALPSIYGRGARERADQQRRLDRRGRIQLAGGASVRAHASSGRNGVMFDDLLAQFDFDAPTVNFDYTTKEGWREFVEFDAPRPAPCTMSEYEEMTSSDRAIYNIARE